MFVAAVLNYVDRNVLGLLADTIKKDLNISNQEYATIINYFLIAYTIANLLSGRIVDKLGVRLSLALFVAWWTIANGMTGMARSLSQICGLRFMLGLGEAGCYTASPKAISEWFPPAERAMAVGLYSSGGAVGATIAPIMVALIAVNFGWRWVFAVTPVVAGLWMLLWLMLYKNREANPHITDGERAYLDANVVKIVEDPLWQKESELSMWAHARHGPAGRFHYVADFPDGHGWIPARRISFGSFGCKSDRTARRPVAHDAGERMFGAHSGGDSVCASPCGRRHAPDPGLYPRRADLDPRHRDRHGGGLCGDLVAEQHYLAGG